MLNDDASGFFERLNAFPCCICISDIVVRQFFALQLFVVGECTVNCFQITIESCRLMRVFAVTHFLHFVEMQIQCLRISAAGRVCFIFTQAGQIVGDSAVILCGMRKDFFASVNLVS
jgi:hypothetical protein